MYISMIAQIRALIYAFGHMRPSSKQLLAHAGLPAMLVSDLTNIRYITGLELSAGLLLATPKRFILFVDARYRTMAEKAGGSCTVRDLHDLQKAMKDIEECGFEAETVTVLRKAQWKRKFTNTKFVRTVGLLQEFRREKDEGELRHVRRAHRLTRELLRRVPSALRRQTTEAKLAHQLLIWSLEMGADGLAFDPIVAFGTHTSHPHHRPTQRSLQKGHLVQIDVGVKVRGYCGDMSEVFFTAPPTPEQKKMYKAICEAKDRATDAVRPGISTQKLDAIAREVLRKYGIEAAFCHALGHGVGLDVHEGVTLSQKAPPKKLLQGEVITIEPGVYFPGKFGMRVEDMIIVA